MKIGRFKASFGKRKGKSNDTCMRLPESMSSVVLKDLVRLMFHTPLVNCTLVFSRYDPRKGVLAHSLIVSSLVVKMLDIRNFKT